MSDRLGRTLSGQLGEASLTYTSPNGRGVQNWGGGADGPLGPGGGGGGGKTSVVAGSVTVEFEKSGVSMLPEIEAEAAVVPGLMGC